MHDELEGVGLQIIVNVLNFMIYQYEFFTLEELNNRIDNFDYGSVEKSHKPRPLTEEPCKNSKTKEKKTVVCKQSAAESLCLIRYLSLIIGDLIPPGNKYWNIYLTLRKK